MDQFSLFDEPPEHAELRALLIKQTVPLLILQTTAVIAPLANLVRDAATFEERQVHARALAPYCQHQWIKTETVWAGETAARLTQTCVGQCQLVVGRWWKTDDPRFLR